MPLDSARLCGELGCSPLVREPLPKRGGALPLQGAVGSCGVLSWRLGDCCMCVFVCRWPSSPSGKTKSKMSRTLSTSGERSRSCRPSTTPTSSLSMKVSPRHPLSFPAASLASPAALAGAVPPLVLPRCSPGNYQLQNLPRALLHTLKVGAVFKSLAPKRWQSLCWKSPRLCPQPGAGANLSAGALPFPSPGAQENQTTVPVSLLTLLAGLCSQAIRTMPRAAKRQVLEL